MDVLASLPTNSVDSVVTDPPYELGFMRKSWDSTGIAYQNALWSQVLRVLKPGGHLLAFGGARTYHRMACAIEDSGFEIRDQIMWVYSSGFPKSLDIAKAIDKKLGIEPNIIGRIKTNTGIKGGNFSAGSKQGDLDVTEATSELAKQWDGYGTALKPAHEPICMARKPLNGNTLNNVLNHGTGALNIEGCRIGADGTRGKSSRTTYDSWQARQIITGSECGRWPANIIHDGSYEVAALFPNAPGQQGDLHPTRRFRAAKACYSDMPPPIHHSARIDNNISAARFFYCAKTSPKDRHEGLIHPGPQFSRGSTLRAIENKGADRKGNFHPTVKPTELMRYLCRLVTPKGGVILDPFMGSGSTGKAALLEGFGFIGCEKEPEYFEIAKRRIEFVNPDNLFSEVTQ